MCGRFALYSPDELAQAFGLDKAPDCPPRYNIAPSQPVGAIVQDRDSGNREFTLLQWGLIPAWAKDPGIGTKLINARAETVDDKPSFKAAFKYRRCLIPATGFYEWQKQGKGKQPYYFSMPDQAHFAMAGLWEDWNDIVTCTILTTAPNAILEGIHDRMPVILKPTDYDAWLDPHLNQADGIKPLLIPYDGEMIRFPVSSRVNSAKVDDAGCIQPLETNTIDPNV
jgi:putative SOS response-associated peptidase YedK